MADLMEWEVRGRFYLIGLVQAEAECTNSSRSFEIVWLARLDDIIQIYDPHSPLCRLNPHRKNKFPFSILSTREQAAAAMGSLSINLFNETRITILGIQNILDGFQIELLLNWVWLKAQTKLLSSSKSI